VRLVQRRLVGRLVVHIRGALRRVVLLAVAAVAAAAVVAAVAVLYGWMQVLL